MSWQERMSMVREVFSCSAAIWVHFLRPIPFDEVFRIGLIRVRVRIEEFKTEQDTLPLGGKSLEEMADRSIDA